MVDALLRHARDKETFEVTLEPVGIIDAVEKARRFALEIGREQVVDRRVELQKPDLGAGAVTALAVHSRGVRQRRQGGQSADSLEIRPGAGRIGSIFEPPAQLPQSLAQARSVEAA